MIARRESRSGLAEDAAEAVDAGGASGRRGAVAGGADGGAHVSATSRRRRVPYCGEERLLERRLAADEVDAARTAAASRTTGAIEPDDAHPQRRGPRSTTSLTPGERRERRRPATSPAKRSSTWWWARSRSASTRSTWTSRPSRMIATRSQVCSTSRQDVARQEDRPALGLGLADDLVERLLDERVEARRRLVEDEQVGPVLERDDQADLLLVALRVLLELAASGRCRGARSSSAAGRPVDAAAQVGEVLDRLAAGQLVVQRELARQVADAGDGWRPGRRSSRCRRRRPARTSAGGGRAASGSSSSCRRRSGRGSRTPRPSSTSRSTSMMPRWAP